MISVNVNIFEATFNSHLSLLKDKFEGIDSQYPFSRYETLLANKTSFTDYRHFSREITTYCSSIEKQFSTVALQNYHKCLLLYLIVHKSQDFKHYTIQIKNNYLIEYQRIVDESINNRHSFYSYDNDLFCKDLAICTHEMFPVGAFKVEISGVPRRILFNNGWSQFVKSLKLFMVLGKCRPTYEWHLDVRYRASFSLQAWNDFFIQIAEMLENNMEIIGLTGASWFFDPQINTVSPHLGYLRKVIEDNGGEFFFFQNDEHTTELALASSTTRRELYGQGLYKPSSYLTFWSRARLIEWARQQRG